MFKPKIHQNIEKYRGFFSAQPISKIPNGLSQAWYLLYQLFFFRSVISNKAIFNFQIYGFKLRKMTRYEIKIVKLIFEYLEHENVDFTVSPIYLYTLNVWPCKNAGKRVLYQRYFLLHFLFSLKKTSDLFCALSLVENAFTYM